MANTNLSRFESNEGIELVINNQTGESFATLRGLSRMCNVVVSTISKWKGVSQIVTLEAEIQTGRGLQSVSLFSEDNILEALKKYNPGMLYNFAKLGLRVSLHRLAEFELPTAPATVPVFQPTSYEKATCVNNLAASLQMFGIEIENPRFKQAAKDLVCDVLGLNQNQKSIESVKEIWLGVAERAEQLGYNAQLVSRFRSTLGKFVKASELECRREKRLCNGTEREINLYLLSDELDVVIKEYMDAKVLAN